MFVFQKNIDVNLPGKCRITSLQRTIDHIFKMHMLVSWDGGGGVSGEMNSFRF